MRTAECFRLARALRRGAPAQPEQRHLFACPRCRALLRMEAAWKTLRRTGESDRLPLADEAFIRRVVVAVRGDRRRRSLTRKRLVAAAALLFFFLVGAVQKRQTATAVGAEEAYAQLVASGDWGDLLPAGID